MKAKLISIKQQLPFCLLLGFSWLTQAQCIEPSMGIWQNSWQSCQTAPNPNTDRPSGHWILYDFGKVKPVSKVHVWNINEVGQLNNGFRNVSVDYSVDGKNWTTLGNYEFPQASGEALYGGFEAFDLEGAFVRYVALNAESNWGGACYGIAEIKFNLLLDITEDKVPDVPLSEEEDEEEDEEDELEDEEAEEEDEVEPQRLIISPNPAKNVAEIYFETAFESRGNLAVYTVLGQRVYTMEVSANAGNNQYSIPIFRLPSGIYFVRLELENEDQSLVKKLIVNQ